MDKKILAFIEEHDMQFMPHYNREQYSKNKLDREVEYYTVFAETSAETSILLGRIQPNCSYEQFLEEIALTATSRAKMLSTLINEMEEEKYYIELTADAMADELKERENKNEEYVKENECQDTQDC